MASPEYDPITYWNHRKNPNQHRNPTSLEKDFLMPEIKQANKILEVGPGIGRLFSLYGPEDEVCGIDISERYEHKVKSRAAAYGLNYEHEVLNFYKYQGLPYKSKLFDLCIAVKVLLHTTPNQIDFLMCEMARVAEKVMITSKIGDDPARHVFNHNYREIIERNNLCIIDGDIIGNQIHLIYYGY